MGSIEYATGADGLVVGQLDGGFFEGWTTPLTPEEHLQLLQAASHVVVALEGKRVVGFVTALSDRVLTAYIPLLEVLPQHRRRGVATELVRRLLADIGRLYMIDVVCDADVLPFYERLGFHVAAGAVVRHHDWRHPGSQ